MPPAAAAAGAQHFFIVVLERFSNTNHCLRKRLCQAASKLAGCTPHGLARGVPHLTILAVLTLRMLTTGSSPGRKWRKVELYWRWEGGLAAAILFAFAKGTTVVIM